MEIILTLSVDNGGCQQRRTVFVRADSVICVALRRWGRCPADWFGNEKKSRQGIRYERISN
jgi:hypothetical protein